MTRKLFGVLFLVALSVPMLGASSCALDAPIGVGQEVQRDATGAPLLDAFGKPITKNVILPGPAPAEKVIGTASDVVNALPPNPITTPIGLGLLGLTALLHVLQYARTGQWKAAALSTAQGVSDVVHKLDTGSSASPIHPADVADMIKAAVDVAHDGAGVSQTLQNLLTPKT